MAGYDKDDVPMLREGNVSSRFQAFVSRNRSASFSVRMNSSDDYDTEANLVGYTGPLRSKRKDPLIQMSGPLHINRKPESHYQPNNGVTGQETVERKAERYLSFNGIANNDAMNDRYHSKMEPLIMSGQLGMCNDPYCTICPADYKLNPSQQKKSKSYSGIFDSKDNRCIAFDWSMAKVNVVLRSITDIMYFLNILLQFRLAYVARESRVVGTGELVVDPKKIAWHYLRGFLFVDLFNVLPLPQIVILLFLPRVLGSSRSDSARILLRTAVLFQYIPRLFRFIYLLAGWSPSGFIFETAWENFFINLLILVLSSHVVGSCWYLFGIQRVGQCLRDTCHNSNIMENCKRLIDCEYESTFRNSPPRELWKQNEDVIACFQKDGPFDYGVYGKAVNLTTKHITVRYIYSLFWGLQQIGTLAGNQEPSYFVWEIVFTMLIVAQGLLVFAFLIGNMQNFLQALGRRRLEMSLRQRDVEQWMSWRRFPLELRRKVREAERYNWAATRGVDEKRLMEDLSEDLQREIRRHLFEFVKKLWIFSMMDEHVLDSICGRLRPNIYLKESEILSQGCPVEKMVFIVRGKLESIGQDRNVVPLGEGNVCGEELLIWCLENSATSKVGKKINAREQQLICSRTVRCLTNVEAFSLKAADLEEITSTFTRSLRNPRVQGAIRYESPYWRTIAAIRIQAAWQSRQKRLKHNNNSNRNHSI